MKKTVKLFCVFMAGALFIVTACSKESAEAAETIAMGEKDEISSSEESTYIDNAVTSKGEVVLKKASILIDDFSTGTLTNTVFGLGTSSRLYQSGSAIIGNSMGSQRMIYSIVNKNPFDQSIQVSVDNDLMAITAAYDTRGTVKVNYGNNESGLVKLDQDFSGYTTLKVEFAAKSTINGIYVAMYTGNSRAVYTQHVRAREGYFVLPIPLENFDPIGPNYDISQIDYIRFQFDSRSQTGCSMAINKIWVE